MPIWCTYESEYVSLRCLETEALKNLEKKIGNPFFTTSLNLHGMPAITSLVDIQTFIKKYCPQAILIPESTNAMSGHSSSIVFIEKNLKYEIKRTGEKFLEIKNHLDLICLD